MPLFEVAIVDPALAASNKPEELILPPTPVLAPDLDGAKVVAVHTAVFEKNREAPSSVIARWRVLARPFV